MRISRDPRDVAKARAQIGKRGQLSKYRNVRVRVDGYTFDSKLEAQRYGELKVLEKAGEIESLVVHPRYPLVSASTTGTIGGAIRAAAARRIGFYVADFSYYGRVGRVVEDCKGLVTELAKWKLRHFEAQYGFPVTLIRRIR